MHAPWPIPSLPSWMIMQSIPTPPPPRSRAWRSARAMPLSERRLAFVIGLGLVLLGYTEIALPAGAARPHRACSWRPSRAASAARWSRA